MAEQKPDIPEGLTQARETKKSREPTSESNRSGHELHYTSTHLKALAVGEMKQLEEAVAALVAGGPRHVLLEQGRDQAVDGAGESLQSAEAAVRYHGLADRAGLEVAEGAPRVGGLCDASH